MLSGTTTRSIGGIMLGYTKEDLDEMTNAIDSAMTTVNPDDDPWLHSRLHMARELLDGLWAEGYFD
jgi:hypothetical protein